MFIHSPFFFLFSKKWLILPWPSPACSVIYLQIFIAKHFSRTRSCFIFFCLSTGVRWKEKWHWKWLMRIQNWLELEQIKKKLLRKKKKINKKKNVKDRKYFQLGGKGKHYQANMFPKNVIWGNNHNNSWKPPWHQKF